MKDSTLRLVGHKDAKQFRHLKPYFLTSSSNIYEGLNIFSDFIEHRDYCDTISKRYIHRCYFYVSQNVECEVVETVADTACLILVLLRQPTMHFGNIAKVPAVIFITYQKLSPSIIS